MSLDDRPTQRYLASYFHDGSWWSMDFHAYDWADAEARCKLLNLRLDGLHVATIPCAPVAAPVVGPLMRLGCWVRNIIARATMQG